MRAAQGDLIGHKEDFRVNSQYLMATATVGEELSTEQELGEHSVSLCEGETSVFMETSLLQPNQGGIGGDNSIDLSIFFWEESVNPKK